MRATQDERPAEGPVAVVVDTRPTLCKPLPGVVDGLVLQERDDRARLVTGVAAVAAHRHRDMHQRVVVDQGARRGAQEPITAAHGEEAPPADPVIPEAEAVAVAAEVPGGEVPIAVDRAVAGIGARDLLRGRRAAQLQRGRRAIRSGDGHETGGQRERGEGGDHRPSQVDLYFGPAWSTRQWWVTRVVMIAQARTVGIRGSP